MSKQICRFRFNRALGAVSIATALTLAQAVIAQAVLDDEQSYLAVVRGNDVYVRCGGAESYYPFTKVDDGDIVKVTGEKFGWLKVVTIGPAFDESFGYIKHAKSDTGRFRLAPDGKSGVTLGKTDILAPNLDAKNSPKDSWKALVRLDADQTLTVLQTTQTDKETVHTVMLPEAGIGWISAAYLTERATPEQAANWKAMVEERKTSGLRSAKTAESAAPPSAADEPADGPTPIRSVQTNAPPIEETPARPAPEDEEAPSAETETSSGETESASNEVIEMPAPPATQPAETPKREATLEDLEAAYKLLQQEPVETAEITPLRNLYIELAARNLDDKRIQRYANGRAAQLQIWYDLQQKKQALNDLKNRMKMSAEETEAVRLALERSAEYVAVGRIAASTIYDGQNLPKLLRLQDTTLGRTIAYIKPDKEFEVVLRIDTIVGIVGDKQYDEILRLNIISPRRIDVLTPDKATAPPATVAGASSGSEEK